MSISHQIVPQRRRRRGVHVTGGIPQLIAVWDDRLVNQPRDLHLTMRRHVDLMRLVGTGCMPPVIR